jgi:drug/metabolite transporter (DMT)-like permease
MTGNARTGGAEVGGAGAGAGTGIDVGGVASSGGQVSLSRRPVLLAVLGAVIISSSAILITLAHTGDASTAFYRCALALPTLLVLAVREQRRHGPRRLAVRAGALGAGLLLGVDLVLWNHAITDVGAGVATVLGNLQVLIVAVAAWLLLGERLKRGFLLALPVVLLGVVLVSGLADHGGTSGHALAGIAFGAGTSLTYAGFLLIMRQTSTGTAHVAGPLTDATIGAALSSLVMGLIFGGFQLEMPWHSFGWLLLLSISSQTIGWLLITWSLPRLPAAISSLLLLLQPAAAVVLAAVVLGERPTVLQLLGAVLVCGGVLAASGAIPARRRVADLVEPVLAEPDLVVPDRPKPGPAMLRRTEATEPAGA